MDEFRSWCFFCNTIRCYSLILTRHSLERLPPIQIVEKLSPFYNTSRRKCIYTFFFFFFFRVCIYSFIERECRDNHGQLFWENFALEKVEYSRSAIALSLIT